MESQKQMCEIFLNSLNDSGEFEIINLKIKEDDNIKCNVTNKLWDDKAPILKYFDRDLIYEDYNLEKNKIITCVYSEYSQYYYWFENNKWYRTSDYIEWISEKI